MKEDVGPRKHVGKSDLTKEKLATVISKDIRRGRIVVLDWRAWANTFCCEIDQSRETNQEDDNDKGTKDNRSGIAHCADWRRIMEECVSCDFWDL